MVVGIAGDGIAVCLGTNKLKEGQPTAVNGKDSHVKFLRTETSGARIAGAEL